MTGLDFLKAVADDSELPCAFVFITGNGNEAVAVEAMKLGVRDYLVKDRVNRSSLWRSIRTAVVETELRLRLAASMRDLTAANVALQQEVAIRMEAQENLRLARDVAETANRAKTRFVAMVTHELRTPLSSILGYAQILRLEGGLSDRQYHCVGAMVQAGQHLLEIIEGVLDFAAIESGRMTLRSSVIPLRDLAEQCMATIAPMAVEHCLTLRTEYARDAPKRIVGDPSRLRQILLNLLGNAVKYTASGSIELRMLPGTAPERLRIEVADTGPGIADADRDCLFREFERSSAVTSVEGAGLGLAIAARIVRLMNGDIGHTANPGGGSVFWLELPVGDPGIAPAPRADPELVDGQGGGKRVLLVDDTVANREVIGTFLRCAGHNVELTDCGLEAIRLAREETFDLILMDVRMPRMDGLEATRRIRDLPPPHCHIPILALTASAFSDQVAECVAAGMNGYIPKPVDYPTLVAAIEKATAFKSLPTAKQDPGSQRFERAVLERTLNMLPPESAAEHLRSLRELIREALRLLGGRPSRDELEDMAHALCSGAGMFGFRTLSDISRKFEQALSAGSLDTEPLATQLAAEAGAASGILSDLIADRGERFKSLQLLRFTGPEAVDPLVSFES
jgi:signal transduction histidine kinase/DNA-binding response OmpR family regulator